MFSGEEQTTQKKEKKVLEDERTSVKGSIKPKEPFDCTVKGNHKEIT